VGSCKYNNEHFCSIKGRDFPAQLSEYGFQQEDSVPCLLSTTVSSAHCRISIADVVPY
jgi:hypothetical protein